MAEVPRNSPVAIHDTVNSVADRTNTATQWGPQ